MPRFQIGVRAVVVHPDGARVAVLKGALPRCETALDTPTFTDVSQGSGVALAFAPLLGGPVALLRLLDDRRLGEQGGAQVRELVWHLDPLGPLQAVDWVDPGALPDEERRLVSGALAPPPPVRPDWQRPGWHGEALGWLDAQLVRLGLTRTGEPEGLKHWQISWLWRVPTSGGAVYLKSVPPFFAREIRVTAWLDRHFPGSVPPVLALDEPRRLLLLGHAGEYLPAGGLEPHLTLARTLATLQRGTEPDVSELGALGLPDHGPAWVRAELPGLLHERHFLVGQHGGLTPEETGRLLALRPRLETACQRLTESPIPVTLGHGDLHLGNVLWDGEHLRILDWSDASLTHPFLDLSLGPGYLLPDGASEADRAAFRDAYLEAWTDLLPLCALRSLAEDAEQVAELYRALGYTLGIQPNVEGAEEWGGGHLFHLRALLTLAGAGPLMAP